MNKQHIINTFQKMRERGWDTMYWAIDIHDTCLKSTYSDELSTEFFPYAKDTLRLLSDREDCCLILFTCSHQSDIERYQEFFKECGIIFWYVNENPEVENTKLANFDQKFYVNFYIDDKAGFDPDNDWLEIHQALQIV